MFVFFCYEIEWSNVFRFNAIYDLSLVEIQCPLYDILVFSSDDFVTLCNAVRSLLKSHGSDPPVYREVKVALADLVPSRYHSNHLLY